jgi:hypothetical protein
MSTKQNRRTQAKRQTYFSNNDHSTKHLLVPLILESRGNFTPLKAPYLLGDKVLAILVPRDMI